MIIHKFTGGGASAPALLPIKAPTYWRSKINSTTINHYDQWLTADSADHYTLGLGVAGYAKLGKAVEDATLYDKAISYVTGIMNLATAVPGGYLGWHSSDEGGAESTLREIYCWRFVPDLLEFIEPIPAYASVHDQMKAFLERNIFQKWTSRGINSYVYWSVIHISCHWAKICLYLKDKGSTAAIRTQAQTILDNIDHVGMPNWSGKHIRNHIRAHPLNPGASFWPMYWDDRDVSTGSDVSHGEAVCPYAAEAILKGYGGWGQTDVGKMLNLIDIVWTDVHAKWLIGPTNPDRWTAKYTEFGVLGQFNRSFQRKLDEWTGAENPEKWGTFALNASRLGAPYL